MKKRLRLSTAVVPVVVIIFVVCAVFFATKLSVVDTQSIRVSGIIVDSNGSPIANAKVGFILFKDGYVGGIQYAIGVAEQGTGGGLESSISSLGELTINADSKIWDYAAIVSTASDGTYFVDPPTSYTGERNMFMIIAKSSLLDIISGSTSGTYVQWMSYFKFSGSRTINVTLYPMWSGTFVRDAFDLHGFITDADTGNLVNDARFNCVSLSGSLQGVGVNNFKSEPAYTNVWYSVSGKSDYWGDGYYDVASLMGGTYKMIITKEGYRPAEINFTIWNQTTAENLSLGGSFVKNLSLIPISAGGILEPKVLGVPLIILAVAITFSVIVVIAAMAVSKKKLRANAAYLQQENCLFYLLQ